MSALTVSKEEEKRLKGQGFLNNRGTDEFSARVITVNGKVTAAQHRCMAEAAEKFGNGNLTYTTRLSVEVQGIPYEKIEEFQEFIAKEGLETGGTGAKVRPVVSCKGTTCQYGLLDSYAISEEIFRRFYKGYRQVALPHKFKIAVGGCPNNCVKPNLNDVGIIGQRIPHFDSEAIQRIALRNDGCADGITGNVNCRSCHIQIAINTHDTRPGRPTELKYHSRG